MVRTNPAKLTMLEPWLRSYQPEEVFDGNGRLLVTTYHPCVRPIDCPIPLAQAAWLAGRSGQAISTTCSVG
jgi:hypothetical protein